MAHIKDDFILVSKNGVGSEFIVKKINYNSCHCFKAEPIRNDLRPISLGFDSFFPCGCDDEEVVRKLLVLFASNLFEECPSYQDVKAKMEGVKEIDFCSDSELVKHVEKLIEESKKVDISKIIRIYSGDIQEIELKDGQFNKTKK